MQSDVSGNGLTADDIVASFELMLGMVPDQDLIDYHLHLGFPDRISLGRYILTTDAFQARYVGSMHDEGNTTDYFAQRAQIAKVRKDRMQLFGQHAFALLARTEHGLFAVDAEDGSVGASMLNTGGFGTAELELAASFLSPDADVLVVGGHIGGLAIPLSRLCRRLDVVEANPATQKLLEANILLNDAKNVSLHKFAASDKPEMIQFLMNRDNSGGSKRAPLQYNTAYYYDDPEVVSVKAAPLDHVLPTASPSLIIMDIEGSEYFALRGMQGILSRTNALAIEFICHHIINVSGITIDQFIDPIEPNFEYMYVPSKNLFVEKEGIRPELRAMFERGEAHDGIYFLKEVAPDWLSSRGL